MNTLLYVIEIITMAFILLCILGGVIAVVLLVKSLSVDLSTRDEKADIPAFMRGK